MKLVYLALPYTKPDPQANYERYLRAAQLVVQTGAVPVSGTEWHNLYQTEEMKSVPYVQWLEMALELMSRCDLIIRLPGESNGADMEVLLARKLGKTIIEIEDRDPRTHDRFIRAIRAVREN